MTQTVWITIEDEKIGGERYLTIVTDELYADRNRQMDWRAEISAYDDEDKVTVRTMLTAYDSVGEVDRKIIDESEFGSWKDAEDYIDEKSDKLSLEDLLRGDRV